MNLYQLESNLQQVLDLAESANPDDAQLYADTIASLKDGIADKAVGYGKVIKQLTADSRMLKEKITVDQERLHSLNNNLARLKLALQDAMELSGLEKIKDPELSIWIQNNPPKVMYLDETLVPDKFIKQVPQIQRRDVLNALKSGDDVPGTKLTQSRSIRVR